MRSFAGAIVFVTALALPLHPALAQKDPVPAAAEPVPPGAKAPTTSIDTPVPGEKPSATAPIPDLDGDEAPPPQGPKEKPAPFKREPTVTKDGMHRIPGGRFTMGSAEKTAQSNERPVRVVAVPPFWIDHTEVTAGAYRACVERGACAPLPKTSVHCTYDLGDPQLPISCVPWTAANAYCLAVGKRLPREVEWELAARGTSPVRYPWGGATAGCGVAATLAADNTQRSCTGKKPSRVGAHLAGASPYGVLDMSGNVEEWVADWYADTVSDLSPRAGASHVLRGGGWLSPPSLSRATTRNWGSVRESGPNVGFRCAKDD